jgi:hypothetical protein
MLHNKAGTLAHKAVQYRASAGFICPGHSDRQLPSRNSTIGSHYVAPSPRSLHNLEVFIDCTNICFPHAHKTICSVRDLVLNSIHGHTSTVVLILNANVALMQGSLTRIARLRWSIVANHLPRAVNVARGGPE